LNAQLGSEAYGLPTPGLKNAELHAMPAAGPIRTGNPRLDAMADLLLGTEMDDYREKYRKRQLAMWQELMTESNSAGTVTPEQLLAGLRQNPQVLQQVLQAHAQQVPSQYAQQPYGPQQYTQGPPPRRRQPRRQQVFEDDEDEEEEFVPRRHGRGRGGTFEEDFRGRGHGMYVHCAHYDSPAWGVD
jgi:hypothetical protein